jgi:hypothetical protein
MARQIGDRHLEAFSHSCLASTHQAIGDHDQARHHWQHALAIYTDLGVPETEQVRTELDSMGRAPATEPREPWVARSATGPG